MTGELVGSEGMTVKGHCRASQMDSAPSCNRGLGEKVGHFLPGPVGEKDRKNTPIRLFINHRQVVRGASPALY